MCPADTDASASKSVLFTIFNSQIPLAGKLYKTVGKHLTKQNRKMIINFNETEKTIEIKDGLKKQYLLMNISLIFTLVNSVLFPLFVLDEKQMEWMGFIWIILGIFSIVLFIYKILKKTASEKLNISEISSLTEKQVFGRKRFSLKLKNGKSRDLMEMKNESDIIKTKEMFENIGIQIS